MTTINSALAEFLAECEETLERITVNLALVERREHSAETLNSVYRDMHTLKGSSQLFGCEQMGQIAHAMETCLDPFRDGVLLLSSALVDVLYQGIDVLKKLVDSLRKTRRESDLRAELRVIVPKLAEIASQMADGEPPMIAKDHPGIAEELAPVLSLRPTPVQPIPERSVMEKPSEQAETSGSESIRVQVAVLDSLMNLVGELVLIRNQVIQYTNTAEEAEVINLSQRLNIVTTELQNEVMKTRMQPIGNILSKFQRIVRDVSRELGKEIDLKLEGTETELDKTLIEAVKDPLTHIVRNSMDHGLEAAAERREAGKSEVGQILIRSFHEGGQVVIEVGDDGRGLNRKKIGAKALERGLVTAEGLEKMSDREVYNLIFLPGFSTAEKVSNISGRGVGMDVVKTNIEKIGGVVDLSSAEGVGMTIRLKIPLTLAIVPALIVRSGEQRFAIPQVKLVELVRVDGQEDGSANEIQRLQGQPVFRLRGNLLPLVSLNGVLRLPESDRDGTNIAVLNADSGQFGLIVDAIEDSTDIVVKPLSAILKNLGVYSGATVLGDGSVALVLDVVGLAGEAHIFDEKSLDTMAQVVETGQEVRVADEVAEYLVIDVGMPGRFAVPLCLVNRLEEFQRSSVERAGDQRVVRYRGQVLPIISVAKSLALTPDLRRQDNADTDKISVVVVERDGRFFGLEVDAIIDVIAIDAVIDDNVKDRPSILGTCVHTDGVVVVVDAYRVIEEVMPARRGPRGAGVRPGNDRSRFHVLLVEDNVFFRNHVQQILTGAGFRVTVDVNGEEALTRLQHAETGEFAVMVSDIEMPKMDGLRLAEKVRSQGRYSRMPMLALTTKNRELDREKGLRSGFNKYLGKLDADELIGELDESLGLAKGVKYGT